MATERDDRAGSEPGEAPARRSRASSEEAAVLGDDFEPAGAVAGIPNHAEPPAATTLRRVDEAVGFVWQCLLVVFMVGLVGVSAIEAIAGRFFNHHYLWATDLVQYSVFFIAMTGAALAAQREQQISMDFVTRMVSARTRARLRIVLRLFVIGTCAVLAWGGWEVHLALAQGTPSDKIIAPATAVYALPLGALAICFHMLLHIIIDSQYLLAGAIPPEPEQGAH